MAKNYQPKDVGLESWESHISMWLLTAAALGGDVDVFRQLWGNVFLNVAFGFKIRSSILRTVNR